jgi:DnaJ-domain-containing protein 1
MSRPYLRATIGELEDLFAAKRADTDTLNVLRTELQFRNVPRATVLLAEVKAALSGEQLLTPTAQPGLFASSSPLLPPAPRPPAVILPKPTAKPDGKAPDGGPTMGIDEAYKLLRVTAETPWEEVEQARSRLVQRSHPDSLEGLNDEIRAAAVQNAKRANAAYAAVASEKAR